MKKLMALIPLFTLLTSCKFEVFPVDKEDFFFDIGYFSVEWVINGKTVETDDSVLEGIQPTFDNDSNDFVFVSDKTNHIDVALRKDLILWSENENDTSGKVLKDLPEVNKNTKYYAILKKSEGKLVSDAASTYVFKYTDSNNKKVFLNWQEGNKDAVKPQAGSESNYNYEGNGFNFYSRNNEFKINSTFLQTLGTDVELLIPSDDPILEKSITSCSFTSGTNLAKIKTLIFLPSYSEGEVTISQCNAMTNLEKVYLGQNVTKIADGTFQANTNITDITYLGTKEQFKLIKHGFNWLGTDKQGTHGDRVSGNDTKATVIHCSDGDLPIDESIINPN